MKRTWRPGPLKWWLLKNESGVWGNDPLGQADTPVVRSTDIRLDGTWDLSNVAMRQLTPGERGAKRLLPGDLVVVKSSGSTDHLGKTAIVDNRVATIGPAFSNFVQRLRLKPTAEPRYAWYFLASHIASTEMEMLGSTTTGLRNLSGGLIESVTFPGPPLQVQRAIAGYLDSETRRIDALIAKKQQLVQLLSDRLRGTVDVAVGVGDEVPLRRIISRLTSGPRGWAEFVSEDGVTPFLRITNISRENIELDRQDLIRVLAPENAEALRTRVRENDVLVSITADIGSVGIARKSEEGAAVSQHVALMTPSGCEPEWLAYSIASSFSKSQLEAGQYGGTKTQLSLGDVASLRIRVPSSIEQQRRLAYLRGKVALLRSVQGRLSGQIRLLRERRQALITAAVTGELEIPGAA